MCGHVNVCYNQLITMIDAAGPPWQLMRKERYDRIKGVLIQLRNGDEVKYIRQAHSQCYKWCSTYVLMNDGEGGFILVMHPKNIMGFEALSKDADINVSRLERYPTNILLVRLIKVRR
jgi:hypothetical protein